MQTPKNQAMRYSVFLCLCLFSLGLSAQFSGGFKAGLNFSTFSGDLETDADGNELEEFENTTGFHVGATFAYAITDLFGVKADLMYSQKGVGRTFEGPSYFYVYNETQTFLNESQLRLRQSTVNSYIDIPVMVYHRIGPVEVAGGGSVGLLINSVGSGSARYTENLFMQDVVFSYEANYVSDGAGVESIVRRSEDPIVPGGPRLPDIVGAYYNNDNDELIYRRLDFGLVGEVNVFLNNGLFVGVRYNYGLTDVTNENNDQQLLLEPGDDPVNRDDKDYNRSIQASIGFRF